VTATDADAILDLERDALARWCSGDPGGFLAICAPDVVYFDPFLERRLDGLDALTRYYEGIRGKVSVHRHEILEPRGAARRRRRRAHLPLRLVRRKRGRLSLELHRGLSPGRRPLADHPDALVLHARPGSLMAPHRGGIVKASMRRSTRMVWCLSGLLAGPAAACGWGPAGDPAAPSLYRPSVGTPPTTDDASVELDAAALEDDAPPPPDDASPDHATPDGTGDAAGRDDDSSSQDASGGLDGMTPDAI
jgi:hypothetical protein